MAEQNIDLKNSEIEDLHIDDLKNLINSIKELKGEEFDYSELETNYSTFWESDIESKIREKITSIEKIDKKVAFIEALIPRVELAKEKKENSSIFSDLISWTIDIVNSFDTKEDIIEQFNKSISKIEDKNIKKYITEETQRLKWKSSEINNQTLLMMTYVYSVDNDMQNWEWVSRNVHNIAQQKYIHEILWNDKEYNNEYIQWYDNKVWNYLLKISDYEESIHEKKAETIDSREFKNHLEYLKEKWKLNKETLFDLYSEDFLIWLGDVWKEKNDNHSNIVKKFVEYNNLWELFKDVIEMSSNDKVEVKSIIDNLSKTNTLPLEYFEKNIESIYLITDIEKLKEVLDGLNEKGVKIENTLNLENLNVDNFTKDNLIYFKYLNVKNINSINAIDNSFFKDENRLVIKTLLVEKINLFDDIGDKNEIFDEIVRKSLINNVNIEIIREYFSDFSQEDKENLSDYVKYNLFPENISSKFNEIYSAQRVNEFIENNDWESINNNEWILKYIKIHWIKWIENHLNKLLEIGILPKNIEFTSNDENLILTILRHPNNWNWQDNIQAYKIINKIPDSLRWNDEIIKAVVNCKSIKLENIHSYINILKINDVNQLMFLFTEFKKRAWNNSENNSEKNHANDKIIREFFSYNWFKNVSLRVINSIDEDGTTNIKKTYRNDYEKITKSLRDINKISEGLEKKAFSIKESISEASLNSINDNSELIIENIIESRGLSDKYKENEKLQNLITDFIKNPNTIVNLMVELNKIFAENPKELKLFIDGLINFQIKELYQKSQLLNKSPLLQSTSSRYLDNQKYLKLDTLELDFSNYIKEKNIDLYSSTWKILIDTYINNFLDENGVDSYSRETFIANLNIYIKRLTFDAAKQNSGKILEIYSSDLSKEEKDNKINELHNKTLKDAPYKTFEESIKEIEIEENKLKEEADKKKKEDEEKEKKDLVNTEKTQISEGNKPNSIENTHENSNWTYDLILNSGEQLTWISKEEYSIVKGSNENLKNMVNFYNFFEELNLLSVWEYRNDLIKSIWLSSINNKDDSLKKDEIRKFWNKLLTFVVNAWKKEWETHEKVNYHSLSEVNKNLKEISWANWILSDQKEFNLQWEDAIWSYLREYWIIWWAYFQTSKMREYMS